MGHARPQGLPDSHLMCHFTHFCPALAPTYGEAGPLGGSDSWGVPRGCSRSLQPLAASE